MLALNDELAMSTPQIIRVAVSFLVGSIDIVRLFGRT